jgi:hypothetical protein
MAALLAAPDQVLAVQENRFRTLRLAGHGLGHGVSSPLS